jgi:uncharacterized protein
MSAQANPHVTALQRYPVKGLSAEVLDEVTLTPGETVPCDRIYAIENGPGRFDPENPKHLPKINFLMLMRNERLATLETRFDEETHVLTILRQGRQVARGALRDRLGRQMVEQFLGAYMKDALRGPPRIVTASGHTFSDVPAKWLHIINLASLRDLERVMSRPLHPLRFRANVHIDGLAAWEEFGWVGKQITIGGARLEVVHRCQRCEATNVDPQTAARDTAIPAFLQRTWGHQDFGIYAKVITGGTVRAGEAIVTHGVASPG